MKFKSDYTTNSSSTCFTITNKSSKDKTLVDFVNENPNLVKDFKSEYNWYKDDERFTQEQMLICANNRQQTFPAKSSLNVGYGDNDGDTLGHVFDYILRDGGQSKSFKWKFKEYWR